MKKAVLISCFNMYKRLMLISEILKKEFDVTILISDFVHHSKKRIEFKYDDYTYIETIPYNKNLSLKRLLSHIDFSRKVLNNIEMIQPDFIYALLPPNSIASICAIYKRKNKHVRLIFDVIDMWPESMPVEKIQSLGILNWWKKLRDKNLQYADHIFTECALYQKYLKGYIKGTFSTLYLYKDMSEGCQKTVEKKISQINTENTSTITICYLGSINYIIDLEGIGKVVSALSSKYKVIVRIIGEGESRNRLIEIIKKAGGKVEYFGVIYDESRKIELLAGCDFALNMMIDRVKVGLTIKSIDYLSYGLPLINNIKGDTWSLVQKYGIGINFDGDIRTLLDFPLTDKHKIHVKANEVYTKLFTKNAFLKALNIGLLL